MKFGINARHYPLLVTAGVLIGLFAAASILYRGFFSLRVATNLFSDNAFLGIAAVGMTFVILSGGIDLSVGAVAAFSGILVAVLVAHGQHPVTAMAIALVAGVCFGTAMGALIHFYELPPFLVTLGGMFFARGLAFMVSMESVGIQHAFYLRISETGLRLTDHVLLPVTALAFLLVFGTGLFVAHFTCFGRAVYAIGGNEESALLMGLPVGGTRIGVYALNGACSALAGIVATVYMGSGNPAMGFGLELDAIAAVVIGGTLLTGGVGSVAGTLAGVLIFGTIQSALVFDGRLNSWWLRIVIGALLLLFICVQRLISVGAKRQKRATVGVV